ncbi:MAG: adenylate/guanylate cyclase domain-containing protein [Acidimicrobiales bacterium]
MKVRMGIHSGEVQERDGDYFGSAVNRAARLMAIGHGGQVVCSAVTASLLDDKVDLRDLGEYRLRDLLAPQRVFQIGDGRFPALRSIDAVPSNLPTQLTELIGRSADVESLARAAQTERLMTLTGTGGVGKTRLALAVAAGLADDFSDGCWLVELAPQEATGVTAAVAAALGMSASVIDTTALVGYLAQRRLVLVLDNCEHVLDAVADLVAAVLGAAPEVHVIVTWREPLALDGEVVRGVRY